MGSTGCDLLLEDGTSALLLEDGTSHILLEGCTPSAAVVRAGHGGFEFIEPLMEDELPLAMSLLLAAVHKRRLNG